MLYLCTIITARTTHLAAALFVLIATLTLLPVAAAPDHAAAAHAQSGTPVSNVLTNGDAEDGTTSPAGWSTGGWQPQNATFTWDGTIRHAGARSLSVNAGAVANDVRWTQSVTVPAGSTDRLYRLSGWIKTEGVTGGYGASLGNENTYDRTAGISGTTDWTYVSMILRASAGSQLRIAARLGHFNAISTGRAWFDDIQLVELTSTSGQPPAWKILVLVYPTTDFIGEGHHFVGTMSNADRDSAIATATRFVNQDIPALNSGFMVPEVTVRVVPRALELSFRGRDPGPPERTFWGVSPDKTAPEHDPAFDSVISVWNGHVADESSQGTVQRYINADCGLAYGVGINQTYASIPVSCIGGNTNVFKHEWGHSILFYHEARGVSPVPAVNNHIDTRDIAIRDPNLHYVHCPTGTEYILDERRDDSTIPNTIYHLQTGFTHDYYSGTTALAASPSQCLGIPRSAWAHGGPTKLAGDPNPPSISVADATVVEGDFGTTQLSFPLTLPRATSQPVSVRYQSAPGTATSPSDFTTTSGVVTFPPGQITTTVTVTVQGDALVENNETLTLQLDDAVNAFLADGTATGTIVSDEAPPPMGWNSWTRFGCAVDENLIRQSADAMIANNLKNLGYSYVNIDDCWMAPTRDAQGRLQADPIRFPSGIKALADYMHARGLKLGIYASAGTATCQGLPGSLDREVIDAQTFAAWEVDYLKYGNCNHQNRPDFDRYKAMGDALKATGRPIVYSIANWGLSEPWIFGPQVGAGLWRTAGDSADSWSSVTSIIDQQNGLEPFARKNGFNDPDVLHVGNGGMTTTEYTAHVSLWALLSAPLLLGTDLRSLSPETLSIIRNPDVIAVNQDWGGSQGRKVRDFGETEVWAKPMSDGSVATVLLNRTGAAATVTTSAAELGLGGSSSYSLRNLWTGSTSTSTGAVSASVPSHGTVMLRVTRAGSLAAAPVAGTYQVGDMTWLTSSNGWGPAERNRSNGDFAAGDGRTLTINGTTFAKGLGVHADSAIHLYLGRACPRLTAQVGVDDEVTDPTAAVRFQIYGDGRLLAYSGIKRAADGPTRLTVATGGYSTVELRVTDARNGINYDHADWGAATLTCTSPGTGSHATWTAATNGWGPVELDQSNGELAPRDGIVPSLSGVSYVKAFGVHAVSDITLNLGGNCERFTTVAGIDDEAIFPAASVVFSVVADGVTLYTSPTVTLASGPMTIDLNVTGRNTLHLLVGDAGNGSYDHADWADPRLLC